MIRVLQILIFGHVHKWKIIKESPLKNEMHGYSTTPLISRGVRYVLQCETCGELHQKDVI